MLSRDQSLRSDTWNLSGTQGNVFGNPQAPYQGILHSLNQSATGGNPVQKSTGKPVARSEEQIEILFQRRDLQGNCQPWILSFRQKNHRIIRLLSKDCKSRSFFSINSPSNVYMLEDKLQNLSKCLFRFSLGGCVMDQRSGDGRFGGWFKIIAIFSGLYSCPEFWDAGRENCIFSEQGHLEFPLQWKGQSGGTESSARGSVPSRKTDRSHDLRLLSSDWRSWYCSVTHSWLEYPGTRYEMGWNSIIHDQDPTGWYPGKFVQIKSTWVWSTQNCTRIVWHGNWSEDIDAWSAKNENDGEENHRSETSTKFWRQKWENWNRCNGYESQGIKWCWKETRSLLSMESKRAVFERRQMQFPARQSWACKINIKNHSILWATNTKR